MSSGPQRQSALTQPTSEGPDRRSFRHPALAPFKRRLRSVITGGTKLIWGSDGRQEMFDLAGDPDELVNVWNGRADTDALRRLEGKLDEAVSRFGADRKVTPEDVPTDALDDATREALRSLGYLR